MDAKEPRTTADIIRDLFEFALDREWSGSGNTSCNCHPTYEPACPECGAYEDDHKHEPGCKLARILQEAQAFLVVEDELRGSGNERT